MTENLLLLLLYATENEANCLYVTTCDMAENNEIMLKIASYVHSE